MPCGGIYPGSPLGEPMKEHPCWVCRKSGCDLFCDEWDTPIHSKCVEKFLTTDEGRVLLVHGHNITILKNGKRVVLYEGEG